MSKTVRAIAAAALVLGLGAAPPARAADTLALELVFPEGRKSDKRFRRMFGAEYASDARAIVAATLSEEGALEVVEGDEASVALLLVLEKVRWEYFDRQTSEKHSSFWEFTGRVKQVWGRDGAPVHSSELRPVGRGEFGRIEATWIVPGRTARDYEPPDRADYVAAWEDFLQDTARRALASALEAGAIAPEAGADAERP